MSALAFGAYHQLWLDLISRRRRGGLKLEYNTDQDFVMVRFFFFFFLLLLLKNLRHRLFLSFEKLQMLLTILAESKTDDLLFPVLVPSVLSSFDICVWTLAGYFEQPILSGRAIRTKSNTSIFFLRNGNTRYVYRYIFLRHHIRFFFFKPFKNKQILGNRFKPHTTGTFINRSDFVELGEIVVKGQQLYKVAMKVNTLIYI